MDKIVDRVLRNPISFEIVSIFVYSAYCLVFAAAAIPSALLLRWGTRFLGDSFPLLLLFIFICFLAFYLFLISSAVIVGSIERVMTRPLKPGAYPTGSPEFFRWLACAGLHLWMVHLVLRFLRGNNWIKIYLRIAGAKVGKEVFINTENLFDIYLLEIQDNVIVGGETFISCHLFEGGYLNLERIVLGEGTIIGAGAYLTPGTHTGKNSKIGMFTYLRRNTTVRDGETLITPPGMSMRQVVKIMRAERKDKVHH